MKYRITDLMSLNIEDFSAGWIPTYHVIAVHEYSRYHEQIISQQCLGKNFVNYFVNNDGQKCGMI